MDDMTQEQRERAAAYSEGYGHGLTAAHRGYSSSWARRTDQWKAGYRSGYAWGLDHPIPAGRCAAHGGRDLAACDHPGALDDTVADLTESHRSLTS